MRIKGPIWLLCCLLLVGTAAAQDLKWGGSVRYYQFFRLEGLPESPFIDDRRDSEFGSFRFTLESRLHPRLKFEAHAVADFLSPPIFLSSSLATGQSRTFLPLEHDFTGTSADYDLVGRFDRLSLQMDFDSFRIVAGRQAVTWGVTYFWPVMDLFSPFAPQRVDRDYKEGVDAVRVTVPVGAYSEVQVIAAALGSSASDDGAAAALARLHLGPLDLGLMGGKFHRDTVAGAFFTTGFQGTAYRGEFTWTLSGDPRDRLIDRRTFFRASFGLDRQLTPDLGLTLEFSYNGFGAGSPSQYALLALSDRVQRGEVNALGTYYAGTALTWQLHPLWTLSHAVLVN